MYIDNFLIYLTEEKSAASNTAKAYTRDIAQFEDFLAKRGVESLEEADNSDIVSYVMELKTKGRSKSTLNRKLASIRTYYDFLQKNGIVASNPAANIKSPKIERKNIEFINPDEIEKLMELPDNSYKGIRDRAILELLYATGIRAGELISMEVDDINLRMGFITCSGEGIRARIIPMGKMARSALEHYIRDARAAFVRDREEERHLFVNVQGKALTRQGLWKILKTYGDMAELSVNLTPQVIRNSFAVHMLQNGADIKSMQELMGHEDIAATQAYLAFAKTHIKDVYDKSHPRA